MRQGMLTATLLFGQRAVWGRGDRRFRAERFGSEAKVADVEIFFEAVGLQEVGEFEGADVAALGADLSLEIGNDGAQIWERVAQARSGWRGLKAAGKTSDGPDG